MKTIDTSFEKKLRGDPDAELRVIVRTAAEPAQYTAALEKQGLRVVRVSTLINAVTVSGKAKAVLALGGEGWVTRIEEDKPVHTM